MKKYRKALFAVFVAAVLAATALTAGCSAGNQGMKADTAGLSPDKPVTISIWHYYNGAQQEAFNQLVEEFNETRGKELGIRAEGFSQGNVSDLERSVLDAANHKIGAAKIPSIFAAYTDTAYTIDQLGLAADISSYFTQEELDRYVEGYLKEGEFRGDGSLKIFPVAKSTEIFMLNKTDWDKFAQATGAQLETLHTIEGVTATAEAYYKWTDSLTPEPEDGKAFFGRDAMANYILTGARQLGVEIFTVQDGKPVLNFDKKVMRKLWDCYYIPYVKGYFASSGRFRSDDIKIGNIIALVGSTSGATFFPDKVYLNDAESYPIEIVALECPGFEGGEAYAVQQGAGMVVTSGEETEVLASVEFLKWFTRDEQNIRFSLASGYLPVTKAANEMEMIQKYRSGESDTMMSVISVAVETVRNHTLYTTKAFACGTEARNILEYAMSDQASSDREVVLSEIQTGKTLDEAAAWFLSDEHFDTWYEATKNELEALILNEK